MPTYRLTTSDDLIIGTADDDIVEVPSTISNIAGSDTIQTGAGFDTLLFERPAQLGIGMARLTGLSGIDAMDVSAATDVTLTVDHGLLQQSDNGTMTIIFDGDPLRLDLRGMTSPMSGYILQGTGTVTLANAQSQTVRVANGSNGTVLGGSGADTIIGGNGRDNLTGNDGNDVLRGNGGNDTLSGGAGLDLLTGGGGTNTATGGAGSDTFVITGGETLTITDFAASDPFERIDLRAVPVAAFGDLTITQSGADAVITMAGGTTVRLTGVQASALSELSFVFPGDDVQTLAEALGPLADFSFTDQADDFTGTSGDDIFEISGNFLKLSEEDNFDGGAGTDVLRVDGADRPISMQRLAGMNSVEVIDLSGATGTHSITADRAMLSQSSSGQMLFKIGASSTYLDASDAETPDDITVEGTGLVMLRDQPGQKVAVSDALPGNVLGGISGDSIVGGSRADVLDGARGADTLVSGGGDDTLTGGDGTDSFVLSNVPGSRATITDFDTENLLEVIDLRAFTGLSDISDLTITDTATGARVTGGNLHVTLEGVTASELDASSFRFNGDPVQTVFHVDSSMSLTALQDLLDAAPAGSTIHLAAGTYHVTERLKIERDDISLIGAGEGKTIFLTEIPVEEASPTIVVQPGGDITDPIGLLAGNASAGGFTVTLPDGHGLTAGDILFITQANDAAFLEETNNTGWEAPEGPNVNLREQYSRIVSIDGNTVTLAEPVAYDFAGGVAEVAVADFLSGVHLEGFTIRGTWGQSDPYLYADTLDGWQAIAALELDGVTDSTLENITIEEPASHAFTFQRSYGVEGDSLTAIGAHNKLGSSGYHFYLQESFANHLTGLVSIDGRHAVLTASAHAEHYNHVQVDFTNRDINYHGSPDAGNVIIVDEAIYDFPEGSDPQWAGIHTGFFPEHPRSTPGANTNVFRLARGNEDSDWFIAHDDGGNLGGGAGNDLLVGGLGNDTLIGGTGRDTLAGGAGSDRFERSFDDNNDVITDFEAGADGDVLVLHGYGYTDFSQLALQQDGDDTLVYFGPSGYVLMLDTNAADLVPGNFDFVPDSTTPGQAIRMTASDFYAVGTDRDDSFAIFRSQLTDPTILHGGLGFDTLNVNVSFFTGNLGETLTLTGIDAIDLTSVTNLNLTLSRDMVTQSDDDILRLFVGDTGLMLLDSENLPEGQTLLIDGAREIRLQGGRAHAIQITDRVGGMVVGDEEADRIQGGNGNDSFSGGAGRDTIDGWFGDDTLDGGSDADFLRGGPDSDTYYVDHIGDRIAESAWGGTDHVYSSVNFRLGMAHLENLTLTGTAERGWGNGLGNRMVGNDRNNFMFGNAGEDTMYGGDGNDRLEGQGFDDLLYGQTGNDTLVGGGGNDTMDGGIGADVMNGGQNSDTYYVDNAGDRVIEQYNHRGVDHVHSSVTFNMRQGHIEMLTLIEGADDINGYGNHLNNTITGNSSANRLLGGDGRDTLDGWFGDDTLDGGDGADLMRAGPDSDTYYVDHIGDRIIESAWDGTDHVYSSVNFRLGMSHLENLTLTGTAERGWGNGLGNRMVGNEENNFMFGNAGEDTMYGGDGNDRLEGQGFDDLLYGQTGNDTLVGGGGNDTMDGGIGADVMNGGQNSDTYYVDNVGDRVIEQYNHRGVDHVYSSVDFNMRQGHIEMLTLVESGGNIDGFGNHLNNTITGNSGNNRLVGAEGRDTLEGGAGADQFVFNTTPDAGNVDTILDFTPGEDSIHLSLGIFGGAEAGMLSDGAFVLGTEAQDANDRVIYDQATGRLWYDANGSAAGGQMLFAALDNAAEVSASDFLHF
ncbi:hypothetical protein [Salipiger bermudensis]|uniref:hypothetical protein n=1 Tax=Salipiger bermudensis TaxID=344736 RepID=UPI0021E5AEF3|nr:hypothetical protein [Salipiger bermudensis]